MSVQVDLIRLGEALNACDLGCLRVDEKELWYPYGGIEMWWNPDEGEAPELAFAMLGALEKSGFIVTSGGTVALMERYQCRAQGRSQATSPTGFGATLTEAIANTLIAAHDAGLLSVDSQVTL